MLTLFSSHSRCEPFFRNLVFLKLLHPQTSVARSLQAGFTLVEVLVVLTIISLTLGLVGPQVLDYLSQSKVKAAKIQISSFSGALDLFMLDVGRYPSTSEGIEALTSRPSSSQVWNGPYLKGGKLPTDPWGNKYVYRTQGDRAAYEIVSYGSDGRPGGSGTAADISSVER